MNRAYLAFGAACLSWYAGTTFLGWEWGNPHRQRAPAPMVYVAPTPGTHGPVYIGRSPGGYGSSSSGSGFGGGK